MQKVLQRKKSSTAAAGDPNVSLLAKQIERHLTSIRQKLRQPLEAEFARGHLTGPQRSVMSVVVATKQPLRMREITQAVGLAQSTVSGIVDRLVHSGMLVRTADPEDARASRIAASAPVRRFLEKRVPQLTLSPLARALRSAGVHEAETIHCAVARLDELLSNSETPPARTRP